MIVVATADFEVYHGVVNELRDRGVTFTTIEPGDEFPVDSTAGELQPSRTARASRATPTAPSTSDSHVALRPAT